MSQPEIPDNNLRVYETYGTGPTVIEDSLI